MLLLVLLVLPPVETSPMLAAAAAITPAEMAAIVAFDRPVTAGPIGGMGFVGGVAAGGVVLGVPVSGSVVVGVVLDGLGGLAPLWDCSMAYCLTTSFERFVVVSWKSSPRA